MATRTGELYPGGRFQRAMEDIADDLNSLRPRSIELPDLEVASTSDPANGTIDASAGPLGGGADPKVAELVNALKAEINRMAAVQFRVQKTENEYPDW